MKGVIFAELIRWVEEGFSPALADAMIVRSQVSSGGVYTTVGNYPHDQALAMIGTLADLTGESVPGLADRYGYWLATRFVELYPDMFIGYTDAVSFLRDVDTHMHSEVKKLYTDAKTPSVTALTEGDELAVTYTSHRPFAEVAYGLIRGYIDHFDDALLVVRDDTDANPHAARFLIYRRPQQGPIAA